MLDRQATVPLFGLRIASDPPTGLNETGTLSIAPLIRGSLGALLVALAYYAGSELGFLLKPANTVIATFWPPGAILLAAFVLAPTRNWWIFLLASLPAHLVVQLPGTSLSTTLGWFVANTSGPLLGAAAIRRLKKDNALFDSLHGLLVFLTFGVLVPPLVKSFLNALVNLQNARDANYWMLGTTRLSANIISGLILVPTIVMFVRNGASWFRSVKLARYMEALVLGFCTVLVSFLVFGRETATGMIPVIIAPPALLLWAVLRFGLGGLSASLLGVALISIWNTIHGQGPIGMLYTVHDILVYRVLLLHSLLMVFGLPLMLTAVLIAELRREDGTLAKVRRELIYTQEQEWQRIARELHTNVAGRLTLVALNLARFRTESDASAMQTDQLYGEISGICKDIIDLSHEVHPFMVEYLGLTTALKKLCGYIGLHGGMTIHFSAENVPLWLPLEVSQRLFRVAKAALRNVFQDSSTKIATVQLKTSGGRLLLRIVSHETDVSAQRGEAFLREQLISLGGTLQMTSVPSQGFVIEASVPINVNQHTKSRSRV
jgi:integral membrane sensor domain MASE1